MRIGRVTIPLWVPLMATLILVGYAFGNWRSRRPPLLPTQLGQQIISADRVVLSQGVPPGITLEGGDVQSLVRAVLESKGRKLPTSVGLTCAFGVLQFYKGTNLLAEVESHSDHFVWGDGVFTDSSGVLRSAWDAVRESEKR